MSQSSAYSHQPTPTPFQRSNTQQLFKAKNVTILPRVANLINTCKAKQMDYRILFPGDEPTVENTQRMSIVVDDGGNLLRQYYG